MKIVCPHCNFSREVPDAQIPDRPVKVTCPQCQQGFSFDKSAAAAAAAVADEFTATPEAAATGPEASVTTCPACGLAQPAGESCGGCGVIYAKWATRHNGKESSANSSPHTEKPQPGHRVICNACSTVQQPSSQCVSCGAVLVATASRLEEQIKFAGFWVRFVAYLIDSLILGAVQFGITLALGFAGGAMSGFDGEESLAMGMLTWLCGMVVGFTYAVFFTGYNGQTPGKMALRIQVVRTDGTPMTYGRAFLREVVGKFASAIILGIGYLMAGFDRNKQALHDKIAGTYVIRL